ncbi:hypothetical protein [Roseovarius sp. MMSF_3281]|uniref:hypothetical protein n=1 Tax=Roseovarius sp. MMSF_3281 TaxID=3046694 RepID=UPI00273EB04D|nr:hypothetical protein [Roseovarius sp. MMSF_3281]
MLKAMITITALLIQASIAHGQGSSPGSATIGGGGDCLDVVDGQSVEAMIADAGSIEHLHEVTVAQIEEYDRWLVEMEAAMNQGVREAEIKALYEQGQAARALNVDLKEALECRMGA